MMPGPIPLELTGLTKAFRTPEGTFIAVENVSAIIREREFVCILGHSGCGKSTVLSIIAGLQRATLGGVVIDGTEVLEPGADRAVVFQSPCLLPWLTARQNVELAMKQGRRGRTDHLRQGFGGREVVDHKSSGPRERPDHYLELVGVADCVDQMPGELSLGTQQCVSLARALSLEPRFLLLDEPFSMLDSLTRFELQDTLLQVWERQRKTVVMVTHDVDEALYLADRLILMTDGPAATVGEILTVPFPRPRERAAVLEHAEYYACHQRVIDFLENHARQSRAS
jgi:nitrate/nitrite transport system ATP-binding protein